MPWHDSCVALSPSINTYGKILIWSDNILFPYSLFHDPTFTPVFLPCAGPFRHSRPKNQKRYHAIELHLQSTEIKPSRSHVATPSAIISAVHPKNNPSVFYLKPIRDLRLSPVRLTLSEVFRTQDSTLTWITITFSPPMYSSSPYNCIDCSTPSHHTAAKSSC